MTEQQRRPDLRTAVQARLEARQKVADEATAPEREAREKRLADDAALYGTAGWAALGPARREMASAWAAQQAQGGGSGAA